MHLMLPSIIRGLNAVNSCNVTTFRCTTEFSRPCFKELLLFAGRYSCFFKSIMWCFRTGCHCPRRLPLFSLPYIYTKDPCMSAFFYLKVTCSELSSSTRVLFSKLCTMHNHLLSFLSFHNHINTFSCSSFIRSKGK